MEEKQMNDPSPSIRDWISQPSRCQFVGGETIFVRGSGIEVAERRCTRLGFRRESLGNEMAVNAGEQATSRRTSRRNLQTGNDSIRDTLPGGETNNLRFNTSISVFIASVPVHRDNFALSLSSALLPPRTHLVQNSPNYHAKGGCKL